MGALAAAQRDRGRPAGRPRQAIFLTIGRRKSYPREARVICASRHDQLPRHRQTGNYVLSTAPVSGAAVNHTLHR